MRIGIGLATVTAGRRLSEIGGELTDFEKAGAEVIFVAELYGLDAVSRRPPGRPARTPPLASCSSTPARRRCWR
jgi:hypothetical protein